VVEFIQVQTAGQGLYEITDQILEILSAYEMRQGLCTAFVRHTSASLTVQENADPSAKRDLEYFLNKLVPENDPGFTHVLEGADDMPSHIKAALTSTSVSIPIHNGQLVLGTWQGVYLWEHRKSAHLRSVAIHFA
jgi:secondary thiamine-phosphate synthase enzyme